MRVMVYGVSVSYPLVDLSGARQLVRKKVPFLLQCLSLNNLSLYLSDPSYLIN
jgi:hypothetical protein